ncbi:MAG: PBP1A family penicillin-binding protein, partial [Elusimicrobiota bacterium]
MARRRLKRKTKKILIALSVAGLALGASGVVALIFYAEQKLSRLVLGGLGESFSTKVFGAPFVLTGDIHPSPEHLIGRLKRLGYRPVEKEPQAKGEFFWEAPTLSVFLKGFELPQASQAKILARLTQQSDGSWALSDQEGRELGQIAFEPELVAELSGPDKVRRDPASWEEIPETFKMAVIAAEDRTFLRHHGMDPRAIIRAFLNNILKRGRLQGASTITQQLAKNLLLTPRRTLKRKLVELALAFYLEARYSKREILTLYLNHIYLGQDGLYSVAGIKAAARFYFDKKPGEMTLPEAATIAGLARSPYQYNPLRDPQAAKNRRNFVLKAMAAQGAISQTQMKSALEAPMTAKPAPAGHQHQSDALYFVAELVRQMVTRYSEEQIFRLGLAIHTTMDPILQQSAQRVVQMARRQAALVSLDPMTGSVLALSGGKDYARSQFNRATQALRQPGSAFKPFVYAAALEKGFTPAAKLWDGPKKYKKPGRGFWQPKNFNGVYHGTTTLREALVHSLNCATLDLAEKTGLDAIKNFARRMGFTSPLENNLSLALGSSGVTPWEIAGAYAPLANGGFRVSPRLITSVMDAEGTVLEFHPLERSQAIDPALAYLMTSLLEDVMREGTASAVLKRLAWNRPAAGKTGTTNDGRDAWFLGYTNELVTCVWAGDDEYRAIGASGARDAVPIWAAFMKEALLPYPLRPFAKPEGVVTLKIDILSGLAATSGCPQTREEIFLAGTQPAAPCPLHRSG